MLGRDLFCPVLVLSPRLSHVLSVLPPLWPQHATIMATMSMHLTWWDLVVLHASQQLGTCRPAYCWVAAFSSALVTHNFEIPGLRMAEG